MSCGEMVVGARELVTVEAGELARLQAVEAAACAVAQTAQAVARMARWALADEAGKREFAARVGLLLEACQQMAADWQRING